MDSLTDWEWYSRFTSRGWTERADAQYSRVEPHRFRCYGHRGNGSRNPRVVGPYVHRYRAVQRVDYEDIVYPRKDIDIKEENDVNTRKGKRSLR